VDLTGVAYIPQSAVKTTALRGPSGQAEIPLKMKGPMSDPKPDYAYTLGILLPRIAKNTLGEKQDAAKAKAVEQARKIAAPVVEKLQQQAPEPVKKQIDDLRKKFKF
jgi:hypothetical protein